MAYLLSATKLKSYARCPKAYYFRYECGLNEQAAFASASLGTALHGALAQLYQDWHYQGPLPSEAWLRYCWEGQIASLTDKQVEEGWQILQRYCDREILPLGVMKRPLATEGRVQGLLQAGSIEFKLTGRYDRLDLLDDGLELIDYKSAKHPKSPSLDEADLQLGLYHLALEQHYGRSLRRMTLLFLRSGERVTYKATSDHRQQVIKVIGELAQQLREEGEWQPNCGEQCSQCSYARYCPAVQPKPLLVAQKPRKLQLSLSL
ncbi:MAG: PD-(D/E)XK nuclease family protein [Cyanobacteria bacterium P01_A01_bin.17]